MSEFNTIAPEQAVALAGQLAERGELLLVLTPGQGADDEPTHAPRSLHAPRTLHARQTDLPRELASAGAAWTLARPDGTVLARFGPRGVLTLLLP